MEENTLDDELYTPQVGDERKPKIGMQFTLLEDAFSFYNQYAREAGFSARMSNSKKNKVTDEVVWKKFVCFKEGHTDVIRCTKNARGDQPIKGRACGEIRTGCKSRITIVKKVEGPDWIVSTFVEDHNHLLSTPSKVHLLRSHRNVSVAKKLMTQLFSEANVPTCKQMCLLEIEYGGPESVGCTERDIRNFERETRDEQKAIDAESVIEFFVHEKEKNSLFFFDYESDGDRRLNKFFWADPVSRRAYKVFGDVVVFDTTYNTNRYGMIFAPIVGVNHHHQTIVFGCGLLSDERTESFIWLLKNFMEAMSTCPPKVIITDQDPAMAKAIAHVFPHTVHRFCLWHILNKFSEKLSPMSFRDHYKRFKNVIENSRSPDEFEDSWDVVIKFADLQHNEWLALMYQLRHKWVPAYFNNIFCASMSSSQRVESSHAFFKRYISKNNSLMDFITSFNRALTAQRYNELVANHVDLNEHPKINRNWSMESQMVKVYTKKKWLEFQSELNESHGYFVEQVSAEAHIVVYNVVKFETSCSSRPNVLKHDQQMDYVSCSCMKFNFDGIPCKHMLAFLRIKQVFELPEKYILKRWTKDAKVGGIDAMGETENVGDPTRIVMTRHLKLAYKTSVLIDTASLSEGGTRYFDQ